MGSSRIFVTDEFEVDGHQGYIAWNESSRTSSLVCSTCPGRPGGGLIVDTWKGLRESPRPLAFRKHVDEVGPVQATGGDRQ